MSLFHATILSLFPEMFPGPLQYSLAGQALQKGIWSYDIINIRDFGLTKHKKVDDEPYGGGNGLIMRPDVVGPALDKALAQHKNSKIYYPSPRGKLLNQNIIKEIVQEQNIIILCGRFEGVDERIIDEYNACEVSVGDYILSGAEIAALTILDCSIRLLEGVVANQNTLRSESFQEFFEETWKQPQQNILEVKNLKGRASKLLEYPLYTRPATWRGRIVPGVLLSGNHEAIKNWKHQQSIAITKARRPDLWRPNLLGD